MRSDGGAHDAFAHGADPDPNSVSDKVTPREAAAQDEVTQRGAANTVYPGRSVQLTEFNQAASRQGVQGEPCSRDAWIDYAPAKKDHQCPQGVAGVFAQERGDECREIP